MNDDLAGHEAFQLLRRPRRSGQRTLPGIEVRGSRAPRNRVRRRRGIGCPDRPPARHRHLVRDYVGADPNTEWRRTGRAAGGWRTKATEDAEPVRALAEREWPWRARLNETPLREWLSRANFSDTPCRRAHPASLVSRKTSDQIR
jgi:hypothetical protein